MDMSNGLWRSLVSALDWGSRGPGFKSRQPDHCDAGQTPCDSTTIGEHEAPRAPIGHIAFEARAAATLSAESFARSEVT